MQRFLAIICILAATIVTVISQWLSGLYSGVSYGASAVCEYVFTILGEDGNRFFISHSDPYYYLPAIYSYVSLSMLGYILFKSLEKGKWLAIIALAPLGLALFNWYFAHRTASWDKDDPQKYLDAIKETSGIRYAILGILIFIVVSQLVSTILYFRRGRQPSSPINE
jgi:hypothetical protein